MPDAVTALPVFAKELIAGGVAGALGKSSVAPLERAKILIQTGRAPSNRVLDVLAFIYNGEGWRGFFRGNGASVTRIVPYAALHYYTYEHYRTFFQKVLFDYEGGIARHRTPVWIDLFAGSAAGATAVCVTYPLDLVRTRLAWQIESASTARRNSIAGTIAGIVREEGILGLYRGAAPTLLGILPYAGIKFYTYQKLKRLWAQRHPRQSIEAAPKPPLYATLLFGGAAGLIAQTLTYPLDVVRRRMQVDGLGKTVVKRGASMLSHARTIVQHHGWKGMFRGVSINYMKVTPSTAVGFTVYDFMKGKLGLENHL